MIQPFPGKGAKVSGAAQPVLLGENIAVRISPAQNDLHICMTVFPNYAPTRRFSWPGVDRCRHPNQYILHFLEYTRSRENFYHTLMVPPHHQLRTFSSVA
jgi:hypothetical protein